MGIFVFGQAFRFWLSSALNPTTHLPSFRRESRRSNRFQSSTNSGRYLKAEQSCCIRWTSGFSLL